MTYAVKPVKLRDRQTAATRKQVLDTAMELMKLHPQQPFTHEVVAKHAGMGARTVYRYFPSRADLMQALWERVREESKTRFPASEEDIVPLVRETFANFDEHDALTRASLSFSATLELRGRGSLQGRPAFAKSLSPILNGLSKSHQRRLIAVCLGIWSAPFWQLLRDRGELTGEEAQEAAAWTMETILQEARREEAKGTKGRLAPAARTVKQSRRKDA